MKERNRRHYFLLLLLVFSVILWLAAVLISAYRAEGNQIVYREGDYFEQPILPKSIDRCISIR